MTSEIMIHYKCRLLAYCMNNLTLLAYMEYILFCGTLFYSIKPFMKYINFLSTQWIQKRWRVLMMQVKGKASAAAFKSSKHLSNQWCGFYNHAGTWSSCKVTEHVYSWRSSSGFVFKAHKKDKQVAQRAISPCKK